MTDVKIAPSILAADFSQLGVEVERIAKEVDLLHLDVMDGHFVPNISFGMPVIAALRKSTSLPFDCHLMTTNPDRYLDELATVGADLVTIHIETFPDPTKVIAKAKRAGLEVGLVVNPPTPFEAIVPFVDDLDMILIMSVHPGFGGQGFIDDVLPKVEAARTLVQRQGLEVDIQIDGGITELTAPLARRAGANVFVAGTAIFGQDDPVGAVHRLRNAINGAS